MSMRFGFLAGSAVIASIALAACAPAAEPIDSETPDDGVTLSAGTTPGDAASAGGDGPAAVPGGLPAAEIEADELARVALAARLDTDPNRLDLVYSQKVDWPNPGLGCPRPGVSYDSVIVPGYRLLYEHEQRRYVYHTNDDGTQLTDCDNGTTLAVPFELAGEDVVRTLDPFMFAGGVGQGLADEVVIRSDEDVASFLARSGDSFQIFGENVDWETQALVGTVVAGSGCGDTVTVTSVIAEHTIKDVQVHVHGEQSGSCEKAWAQPVWVLLEDIPDNYHIGFLLEYFSEGDAIDTGPPPSNMIVVPAPIEGVEIVIAESLPPQYFVNVLSGLPNGCVRFGEYGVVREGRIIKVKVTNEEPAPGDLMAPHDAVRVHRAQCCAGHRFRARRHLHGPRE